MTATISAPEHLWRTRTPSRRVLVRAARSGRFQSSRSASRAWEPAVAQHAPSFAVIEARKSLGSLALPATTIRSVEAFLESVCTAQSTVPSVTLGDEDDTALLHWVAGPMSVEVEVGPQGATYFWGVDDQAREHSNDVSRTQIESLTRRLVSAIAARVQGSNPGWRRQYLQG